MYRWRLFCSSRAITTPAALRRSFRSVVKERYVSGARVFASTSATISPASICATMRASFLFAVERSFVFSGSQWRSSVPSGSFTCTRA